MFDEPNQEEMDVLFRYLGVKDEPPEKQMDVALQYSAALMEKTYQHFLERCPAEHRAEFKRRAAADPKEGVFAEFFERVMPREMPDPKAV